MAIPSVGSINAVVSHHKNRGSSPKCSPFRHLPNNLIIDIIKTEMDRQKAEKETRDYWIELDEWRRAKGKKTPGHPTPPKYIQPWYYLKVMKDVRHLGVLNKIVQKGGHYKPAPYDPDTGYVLEPILVPQRNLPKARWNKRTPDTNYIMALIRHYSTRGSTMRNLSLTDETAFGSKWMRIRLGWGRDIDEDNVKVSIRVIRKNRERHFKEKNN